MSIHPQKKPIYVEINILYPQMFEKIRSYNNIPIQ